MRINDLKKVIEDIATLLFNLNIKETDSDINPYDLKILQEMEYNTLTDSPNIATTTLTDDNDAAKQQANIYHIKANSKLYDDLSVYNIKN